MGDTGACGTLKLTTVGVYGIERIFFFLTCMQQVVLPLWLTSRRYTWVRKAQRGYNVI